MFLLQSSFNPTGDQPQAIQKIVKGVVRGEKNQVLLGVTGSGKTYTIASVINTLQMPALIISHNKTLAGQLYQEFRDFFPDNAVSYFVSYYDYYQPEAYMPSTDTYIEKEAQINDLIDKLRLQTTANILNRGDVIVVASVSCLYNLGSPQEYRSFTLALTVNQKISLKEIVHRLVELQYEKSDFEFTRGKFRSRGEYLDIYPAYEDDGYRLYCREGQISRLKIIDPITGEEKRDIASTIIYPAKHYLMDQETIMKTEPRIRQDLQKEYADLKKQKKEIEAQRLLKRVNYDLELIKELGYVNGIENYSRYFDGREIGEPPYSLIDYFQHAYGDKFLVIIDESHMTVPQLKGMFNADFSRKKTLIDFGFRLQAAFDNRPLKFEEFYNRAPRLIYVSATPNEWEIKQANNKVVEQLVRPTGLLDPKIVIKPAKTEIKDLIEEIKLRIGCKERVLVTTLTKKTAEDLARHLQEKNMAVTYLHSDIKTLERSNILDKLRNGDFEVLIGVNLLREGLDLPEVSLVAILDADREGFLRSKTSLIQTMGRAARHVNGTVILYADEITGSMKEAVGEIERRREYQINYNKKRNITPQSIKKPIRKRIIEEMQELMVLKPEAMTEYDRKKVVKKLEMEMRQAAKELNFELAIKIRDQIKNLWKIS